KEKIKYGFKKNLGVVEAYEIFLERMKRLIPSRYTKATLLKYTNTKERVREFIKHYTRRNDIYLYELDTQFMEDFDTWIRKTYNINHNTVYKTYQRFTRFLRQEIARGNRRYEAVRKLKWKEIDVHQIFVKKGDEVLTLIHFNRQRIKSNQELLNEYFELESYHKKNGIKKGQKIRNVVTNEMNSKDGLLARLLYIHKRNQKYIELHGIRSV
ncbi:MAG: phage integrase SAM-like domain-containing protein, partial [Sediminibacterium sp.]